MDMRAFTSTLILGVLLTGAVASGSAMAESPGRIEARLQAAVSKIQDACAADLKQFCSTVSPGEGRLLLCMQAHEDKISSKCDYALFEASRNLDRALDRVERVADACWTDIEKQCATIAPGEGNIIACLQSKTSSISKGCRGAIGKVQAAK
jgi:hypothetical protein